MKKVLVLADGIVAKHFLERVIANYATENIYHIVYYNDSVVPEEKSGNVIFYKFDPTSFSKLSTLLKEDYNQVLIALANRMDAEAAYKNIRMISKQLRIVIFDKWGLQIDDQNLIRINSNELLANRLVDYLPNIPVIAQNVGMGIGEIMEVLVPFGSSYVYRHIGSIEQKKWKIVGLYRNNQLMLAKPSIMIQPNDLLLMIGVPAVLKNVYRAINRELGQFPAPYGNNIYLYIDMDLMNEQEIKRVLNEAVYLHQNINDKKLIIRVVNPNNIKLLGRIKSHDSDDVDVEIEYHIYEECEGFIVDDCRLFNVGMVITCNRLFDDHKIRKSLFETRVPVLKLGNRAFSKTSESAILLSESKDLEKMSTAVFDIVSQLGLSLTLYDLDPEGGEKKEIVEHFENLATIFSKPIERVTAAKNPIRELRKKENLLHFIPFGEKVVKKPFLALLTTDTETLYYKLAKHHQIFIPVVI